MKLTLEGIKDGVAWKNAGITLPGYDVEKVSEKAKEEPRWVHFGIGNIFRVFIGGIADGLLEDGGLDRGITCVETFD
ncbi:mannitol dehydrogenase family protein, partial [Lacrimispora saccharolytica]|nr:mannitol dehydrogenase family protein [Lacrimispora saccharolytica]